MCCICNNNSVVTVVLLREVREAGKMTPDWEAAHPQVARLIR
jgi:hypothetical protein